MKKKRMNEGKMQVPDLIEITPESFQSLLKPRAWTTTEVIEEQRPSDRVLRLFAVACAREAMRISGLTDARCIASCDAAESYALGNLSIQDLRAAREFCLVARRALWDRGGTAAYAAYAAATATAAADAAYAARRRHGVWQVATLRRLIEEQA